MKRNPRNSIINAARCQHRTPTGRQCCSLSHAGSTLCLRHAATPQQDTPADFSATLLRDARRFQSAQGINCSLRELYTLLGQDRISPRRASVLAYISSLLLHTLPAIDNDPYPMAGKVPPPRRIGPNPDLEEHAPEENDGTPDCETGNDPSQPDPEDPLKNSKPN
jgi:hypothetical protein